MASLIGIILSLILFCILISFGVFKLQILLSQSEVKYVLTEMTNYYDDTAVFDGGKDSFNVAFGLNSAIQSDWLLDESIGSFYVTLY